MGPIRPLRHLSSSSLSYNSASSASFSSSKGREALPQRQEHPKAFRFLRVNRSPNPLSKRCLPAPRAGDV